MRQDKTRQGKARQGKARQGKARQEGKKARQGKARQGKARQGKARQGKARQGKSSLSYERWVSGGFRRPWTLMKVAFEMSYSSTLIRPLDSPFRVKRERSIIPKTCPVRSRAEINVS